MFLLLAYSLMGGGLKYIDDAFDEGLYDRRKASAVALIVMGFWLYLSLVDPYSSTILTAVLLGVLFSGKIDNWIFTICTALIVIALLGFAGNKLLLAPLGLLVLSAVLDEKGNDYVDENEAPRPVEFFFAHRFVFKLGLGSICLAGGIPLEYFVAFLCFDISYDGIGFLGAGYRGRANLKKLPVLGDSLVEIHRKIIKGLM